MADPTATAAARMPLCALCEHSFAAHHTGPSWLLPVSQMFCRDCPERICEDTADV